jgi:hypothetical protein
MSTFPVIMNLQREAKHTPVAWALDGANHPAPVYVLTVATLELGVGAARLTRKPTTPRRTVGLT